MALLWSNIDYRSLKITGFEVEINLYIFHYATASLIKFQLSSYTLNLTNRRRSEGKYSKATI